MNLVNISAEYIKTANYALFHNRIPICQAIMITNTSDNPIENLQVTCSGKYITRYETGLIAIINPGETVRLSPFNVIPDAAKLASLTERVVTEFTIKAIVKNENTGNSSNESDISDSHDTTTVGELVCELELMPFDHWTGITILPQTIASFITPNHPAINNIVVRSAEILKQLTGSSSFNEYQTGDNNDVRQQVPAIFSALHETRIVYRSLPASFEVVGQRITMPDQVLASKIGNCIELTLLMASVLEAVGLNSLIIINQGHAFLGVWLVDDCYPCSLCEDPAFIEKKCSRGIDEMLVVECTELAKEKTSFETAVSRAEMNLIDHSK
ncbi:MAG: transglutaminase-like domain-containing protein, partial [Muribaculaceae bacterium]|nr:transglutaminase-like domain-containing protein [Muribaculaceae bacterium]